LRGTAIRVNIDDIPATTNIVLLFGDQMHITAGMRYRILTTNPIFNEISKKKIEKQSIMHSIKIFCSLGSKGTFVAPVISPMASFLLLLGSFVSDAMVSFANKIDELVLIGIMAFNRFLDIQNRKRCGWSNS